jgi:hypothetical protein
MVEITPNCETLRMPRDLSRRDPMKVAQYEVLGWRSERVTRPGLSAIVRMPPSPFELRRAREEKAAPQRSDGRTKEERDDRLPACAGEAVHERRGAKRFYRPSGTARVYRSIPGTSYRATFIESLPPSPFGLRRTGRDRSAQARRSFLNAQARRSSLDAQARRSSLDAQARRSFLNAQARWSSLECQLVIANRRTGAEPVVGRFGLSR